MSARSRACDKCLARPWLLAALAGHLDRARARLWELLALDDCQLLEAVGGRSAGLLRDGLERFDPGRARERCARAGIEAICICDPDYPRPLRALHSAPAVLHVAGDLERFLGCVREDAVAVVGARTGSDYGLGIARSLARGLGVAGFTTVSGLALGVDSAAHAGALSVGAPTVAVLAGAADRPYPPAKRALYRQILQAGAVISELPPQTGTRRWMFPARNRIIAGLSAMTVVVEAGHHSGALVTARLAGELGRPVGAVPGRVNAARSAGCNALIRDGALLVRGAQDVLDDLFGAGTRDVRDAARAELAPELRSLLAAIADGHDSTAALARAGVPADRGLAALASLELGGYIRREPGGRFAVTP